jgi:hypothetical protein
LFSQNDGAGVLEISLFTLNGHLMGDRQFLQKDTPTGINFHLGELPSDIYLMKIMTPDGKFWLEKIVLDK